MAEKMEPIMKIADFTVRFSVQYPLLVRFGAEFLTDADCVDFVISPTEQELSDEREKAQEPGCCDQENMIEALACYRKLAEAIYPHNAFIVHGASICVNGEGVMFLAPSGTGKTTHLRLWKQLLGEKMQVVNGDKPIIRIRDGQPVVYGTPFNGKEHYGGNLSAPLRHLCLISRAEENRTEPLSKKEAVQLLLRQTHIPPKPAAVAAAMQFVSALVSSCSLWKISCNMELQAAEVSYGTIFGSV